MAGSEAQERSEMLAQVFVREASRQETIQDQDAQKRLDTGSSEGQGRDALAVHDLGACHLGEGVLTDEAIVAKLLDVEQTSVGRKADGPQRGQINQSLADGEVARVVDGGLGAQGPPLLVVLFNPTVLVIDVERHLHEI